MRLTLRTLLAWLDGVLPEDEQQQLGAKVSGSVVATHLVERIRTAVGRTTIGAPKPNGRGLTEDPNSVAEYLDNTLASEQLEPFERICIESEVHLAEVAACHSLLAEVVRRPAVLRGLPDDERQRVHQRLLGLLAGLHDRASTERIGAEQGNGEHHESRETARAIRHAIASAAGGADGHGPIPGFGDQQPKGMTQRPPAPAVRQSAALAWAVAAVSLLGMLAGVLVWSLARKPAASGGRRPVEVAAGGVTPAQAEPIAGSVPEAAVARAAEPPQAGGDGPVLAAAAPNAEPERPAAAAQGVGEPLVPPATQSASALPAAASPPGPSPQSVPVQPQAAAPQVAAPQVAAPQASAAIPAAAALAVAAPAPPAAVSPASQPPQSAPVVAPQEPVGFVGGEGVLLRMTAEAQAEWALFPQGSQLEREEDLLVPRGFQPELHVRGVTIRLLPETRAVLSIDADGTPRIEVVFGRAVARASQADARLGITAAGLVGTVEAGLLSPVAVECELDRVPGADPNTTPPRILSRVIAATRGLSWRQTAADGTAVVMPLVGIDVQGILEAGMTLEWESVTPDRLAVARAGALPTWIESGLRLDRFEKTAAETLAAKLADTTPLTRALRELAADKRVENRVLAASTLALLGDFDDVVEQLAAESPGRKLEARQWSQLQATTVPLALARGGAVAGRLYDAFVNRGPHGKADVLWAMARGLTDEELAAGADRALVEALDDPNLIIRRYASQSLIEITQPAAGDRNRYRPEGLPEMRRDGVVWWRGQLEKGLIRRAALARPVIAPVAVDPSAAAGSPPRRMTGPVRGSGADPDAGPDPDSE